MPADHRPGRPQARLTAFLTGVGYHESAWRLADPADLAGPARFGVLERATEAAERGLLDAVFFADSPGLAIFRARHSPQVGFDPLEVIAALARSTRHVGLRRSQGRSRRGWAGRLVSRRPEPMATPGTADR